MRFSETQIPGAFLIELQKLEDERGFFARSWCRREFEEHGIDARLVQCNISFNRSKHTLRGMHYQDPMPETKLIRCTQGAIYDVIVDLRPGSAAYKRHVAVELSAKNRAMLLSPAGCAHGFLTLEDDSEIFYQMSECFQGGAGHGVRWNDPAFGIPWPAAPSVISERDAAYPDFPA